MRGLVTMSLVAFCIGGAALAQTIQAPEPFAAEFDQQPQGRDYARNYPSRAIANDIEGAAILCCLPRADRTLDCAAAYEWPAGQGFGTASVEVSGRFRMTPASYAAFNATPGNWIRKTIVWRLTARAGVNDSAFAAISEAAPAFCAPPSAGVPAPENASVEAGEN